MPTDTSTRAPSRAPLSDYATELPPTGRGVVLAVPVGFAVDLAVRPETPGLAAALVVVTAAGALLASGRVTNRHGRALVLAAPAFGVWLAIRTSPWLVPLDAAAAAALLAAGASFARYGSVIDLPGRALVARARHAAAHAVLAPAFVPAPTADLRGSSVRSALRGAALAVPLVVVLGALLTSADAVFASWVDLDRGVLGSATSHVVFVAAGGWAALGLLRTASATAPTVPPPMPARRAHVEATVVLGAVAVLFATFVTAAVVAAVGGADHVLETAGLTRAEYARSGFFQLLWVAGLTIALVLAVDAFVDRTPLVAALRATVIALALAIVATAMIRLDLYKDAYGWTMLRLCSTVAAAWLAAVLLLVVAHRRWFVPASIATGLALLLGLNVVNPEALVARHNLTRSAAVAVDPAYLGELSDDAVPTIVDLLPKLDQRSADAVVAAIGCAPPPDRSWPAWNLAARRAADARRAVCRG